ncbi:gasdermin Eb [Poeciliopsis prolifica]|uniref:gasdermin Eb n=1 Tax=Poeciliopsis prolifica TaxID=188132 RepID=UPI002413C838|nr:gasdermin Eb [Poeciliopsis prolifica]XP_054903993.1 gasdermin Eb [Poeciliopsis prolifica]XP_054903994.1 gasdermin Eb [Poeciliopsis prolifica]XP_054903995.1 gasdermin Eb [Poeciliopsis prolifica]
MFAIATKNFVKEVDAGGLLIPVSSPNDNMELLTVVVKKNRPWFWQKPKYLPTDFTLNDLLTGDSPITPGVLDIDFIKYSGTYGKDMLGAVDASFVKANLKIQSEDSSKLKLSFGSLKKEEVDVPKLMRESKGRVLDMSHSLIQQTKEKQKNVFGIVKERIMTTQPCSVVEDVQQQGLLGGTLCPCIPKASKILLTENGKLSKDSNVTLEIPPQTTMAYGIIELEIKNDGHFELCVMSGGGFEVDGPDEKRLLCFSEPTKNAIQQELEKLKDHFQQLSTLPASARSSLFQHITGLMKEPAAIGALQNMLDQMYLGKKPSLDDDGLKESQQQSIQAIFEVLEKSGAEDSTQSPVLIALHLVVSALEELPDDCLPVLSGCSNPATLQTLELLVQCVSGTRETTLSSTALPDDDYERTEHIFASCNVSLRRDSDILRVEIKREPGNHPLILCIAIKSLASLACGC